MQNLKASISALEMNGASPIEFMNRLNAVLGKLGWKHVDTDFETVEIVVPRSQESFGELYIELDDEQATVHYHIPANNNDDDFSAELQNTVSLFKKEFVVAAQAVENIPFLAAAGWN